MRLHFLELKAYGPFPEKVSIDFEELNEAGIFLLNGPTGSGKSSILDAICYALYGATSMNRPDLRSYFAAEDVAPYVRLEFTVQGERYRILRSPAWDRPKKRNTGASHFTREQAKTDLEKLNQASQEWENLSNRPAEVGSFITDLMGLTREQFTQVMLLPQGEFARFLLSSSKDREELLKKLFSTLEFERIQDVLKQLAQEAEAKVSDQQHFVSTLKSQAQGAVTRAGLDTLQELLRQSLELSFEEIPADLEKSIQDISPFEVVENSDEFLAYLEHYLTEIKAQHETGTLILQATDTEYQQRLRALQETQELIRQWNLHERLTAHQHILKSQETSMQELSQSIEKAQSARAVLQPAQHVDLTRQELETARETTDFALQELEKAAVEPAHQAALSETAPEQAVAVLPEASISNLKEYRQKIQEAQKPLDELIRQEQTLSTYQQQIQSFGTQIETLVATLDDAKNTETQLRNQLKDEQHFIETHHQAQAQEAQAKHSVQQATQNQKLAQKLATYQNDSIELKKTVESTEQQRLKTVEKVNQLYNLRFEQATFVLAQELEENQPCPVCGSSEHPEPATPQEVSQNFNQSLLTQALKDRDKAETEATQAFAAWEANRENIEQLMADGVLSLDDAQQELAQAKSVLREAQKISKAVEKSQEQIKQLNQDLEKHLESIKLDQQKATELDALNKDTSVKAQELSELLQAHSTQISFAQRISHLKTLAQVTDQAHDALTSQEHLEKNLEQAEEALKLALEESHFEDVARARASAMEAAELTQAQERYSKYRDDQTANRTQLASEEQQDIANRIVHGEEKPNEQNLENTRKQLEELQSANSRLTRAQGYLEQSQEELQSIKASYTSTLKRFADVLADAELKRHLADTANGTDSDNTLKMTLTTFVLASQLAEVARAATLHFEKMTHGRYQLKHSDARKGNGKSGLDIIVHDSWHSTDRATATLSGGETFMASLSLALGLADVVQHRNGGIDIDTLFVDEGFGTLDEATLEEVMTTLDELREGGRVIGLISHVSEMKNRISQQILLTTSPEGSRLDTGKVASFSEMG